MSSSSLDAKTIQMTGILIANKSLLNFMWQTVEALSDNYAPTRPQSINLRTISMNKCAARQDLYKEIKYDLYHPNVFSDSNLDNHVSLSRHDGTVQKLRNKCFGLHAPGTMEMEMRNPAQQFLKSLHFENERDLGDGV